MPPSNTDSERYEWRVVYAHTQFGQIAAGTVTYPCRSREQALEVYAFEMSQSHVTGARIERRLRTDWELFDIEEASGAES